MFMSAADNQTCRWRSAQLLMVKLIFLFIKHIRLTFLISATAEITQADQYPYIRLFTVGQNTISATALPNFATIEQTWQVASNLTVGGQPWTYFSSLCWFYGKQIHVKYGIPIGLVSSNWGG